MNNTQWNIDELVGLVMSDLRRATNSGSSASTPTEIGSTLTRDFNAVRARREGTNSVKAESIGKENQNSSELVSTSESDVLEVADRAIVVDVVRRIASGTQKKVWLVSSNAVITPSARDEIKRLDVELRVGGKKTLTSVNTGESSFRPTISYSNVGYNNGETLIKDSGRNEERAQVLVVSHLPEGTKFPPFVMDYIARNAQYSTLTLSCLKEASKRIATEVAANPKLKVVLATYDSAIASVWANRLSGVRAVIAYSIERARRDFVAANANVAIVDPRDSGVYQFRQIVDALIKTSAK